MHGNKHLEPLQTLLKPEPYGVDLPAFTDKGLSIDLKSGVDKCWLSEKDLEADCILFFIPSIFLRKLVPISEIRLNLNSRTKARTIYPNEINSLRGKRLPAKYKDLVKFVHKVRTKGVRF